MIYNVRKMDDQMFRNTIDHMGREVVNYYTNETDTVLVEPNGQLDGGKIYCRSDSWIKRGDIVKVSGEWYVVNDLSNLASDVYNVGVITRCDVELKIKLGNFVYIMPCVVSKYSGNSNARSIIDDSVEGQLSFITGYRPEWKELTKSPTINVFGKAWRVGNALNVNKIMTVYCKGREDTVNAEIGIEPIQSTYKVGDVIDLKIHILNKADYLDELPTDLRIDVAGDVAEVNGTQIICKKKGRFFIALQSPSLATSHTTGYIEVI